MAGATAGSALFSLHSLPLLIQPDRLLDKFESINDQPVAVAYVPSTNMYWASGRFGRLVAYDPRAPANVTQYVQVRPALPGGCRPSLA